MVGPDAVLRHWDLPPDRAITRADSGLINHTWTVSWPGRTLVLQRLNSTIFRPTVHEDTAAVTAHLEARGLLTPRLVPTRSGDLWVEEADGIWRAMTSVGTTTHDRVPGLAHARSAGTLIGRFHAALHDLEWTFRHVRPGAHDTDRHMAVMQAALEAHPDHPLRREVVPLAEAITARWHALRPRIPHNLPTRIIHGDLKLSNVRFDGDQAVALIDLDTLAHGTLDIELGDAMRSWCGTAGEDSAHAVFDVDIFAAAMEGYARGSAAHPPTEAEWASLVPGTQRIATELAARFAADALNESYFGWDPERFDRAGNHNLLRARGQLALARAIGHARAEATARLDAARSQA